MPDFASDLRTVLSLIIFAVFLYTTLAAESDFDLRAIADKTRLSGLVRIGGRSLP